jgi:HK97 gp10 family phage protein
VKLNFKIEGGKALDNALKQLGYDMEKKVAKSAVRAGANVIAKQARINAPLGETGTLKRSIKVVTRSKRTGDAVASVVTRSGKKYTARGMNAWYAGRVEFGPPAHPFLRPALDSKGDEAIKAMSEKIQQRIRKIGIGKK